MNTSRIETRRKVDGILLLDKQQGISSNRALQIAKRLFGANKAGHTGSLDPLATGLLPICFGEATKIAGYLLGSRKAYEAECKLGVTTETDDSEGAVIAEHSVPQLDDETIHEQLAKLTGRITQIPPVYSALKQQGVALYKRARRGEEVSPPPREVEIRRFDLIERLGNDRLRLHVECGSGTYIRSLARDVGEALGCGAHLTALRRLWVEPFKTPLIFTLEQLESIGGKSGFAALDDCLLPLEAGLVDWPILPVSPHDANALAHGRRIATPAVAGRYKVHAADGRLLALAESDGCEVRVLRGFSHAD
ncbi:MAG TPA: tRNA pseudouridine(55) synthase TruB [Rhodanobacteraceae bacterium]|nr:tRNA pseudouridine(55) synthase TruB [Rhodanobacteraceae bacterium]